MKNLKYSFFNSFLIYLFKMGTKKEKELSLNKKYFSKKIYNFLSKNKFILK